MSTSETALLTDAPNGGEVIRDADSPTCPPNGGEIRQQPWDAIGMSRATWYRHGKPTTKPAKRKTDLQIAKMFGTSLRSMQRTKRAGRLVGVRGLDEIQRRHPSICAAAIEREAMYVWIQQQIDAATSEDDKTYLRAVKIALHSKHNEQRHKAERMKSLWRRANEDQRQEFVDWLNSGCPMTTIAMRRKYECSRPRCESSFTVRPVRTN
jgi:hypothetical protein